MEVDVVAQDMYGGKEQLLADVIQPSRLPGVATEDPLVETLVGYPLPRRQGLPLVDNWDCLRVGSTVRHVLQEACWFKRLAGLDTCP